MMQLACIADSRYVRHTGAMLNSALAFCEAGTSVHVLSGAHLGNTDVANLEQVAARFGASLQVHIVPAERAASFPDGYFPRAVWFRTLLPELLPDQDRILYLDSDLIVTDSLIPLWQTDIDAYLLGAVTNPFYPFMPPHPQSLGLAPRDYFNSGVLLMNLRRMREDGFIARIHEFARAHPGASYPDQDALNLACKGQRLALHPRWNVQSTLYELRPAQLPLPPEVVAQALAHPAVVHFIGPFKPWHYLCRHPRQALYVEHAGATPWGAPPLEGRTLHNALIKHLPLAWIDRIFRLERRIDGLRSR